MGAAVEQCSLEAILESIPPQTAKEQDKYTESSSSPA